MPNQLIQYATPEELAEILQLQAKVRAMVNNIHYPLRNLLALLSMRYITYGALTYIPYVRELMWEMSYKLFDGLISYKAGLFDPIDLKNGVVDDFNKLFVANLNLRVLNVEQLEVFCQILLNSFTAKEIQLLLSKSSFLNEATYADNKQTKNIVSNLKSCKNKTKKFTVNSKEKILTEIQQILYRQEKHRRHMALLEEAIEYDQFSWLYTGFKFIIGWYSGYAIFNYLQKKYLRHSPLGLLGLVYKSYSPGEKWLRTNTAMFVTEADYMLQKNHLIALRDKVAMRQAQLRKYSRLAIPLLALIMFVQPEIALSLEFEEAVFFSIISLLGAALSSIYPDLQEYWEKRQFNQQINFRYILLNQLSKELNQDLWHIRKRTTLADSFFSMQFKRAKLKTSVGDLQVSQKDIHQAMLFSLLQYDFPLLAYDNDRIIISAEQRISAAIKNLIAKSCLEHIVLMRKKTKLEEHLANLIKPLDVDTAWIPEDISETTKLPNFAFHIILAKEAAEKIHAALIYLITEKDVSKDKVDDATYHVSVTGIVEIDKTKLDNRISALSARNSSADSISLTHSTTGINRRKKAPSSADDNASVNQPIQRADNVVQVNFGTYGIFNSKTKTSEIIEIRAPFWPRYCHFGFFAAAQNDFADRRKFEKFKNIFDNGEELVAPTGQQGIVQTKRFMRVGDKWELRNSLKLKAPDEDLRVYADESIHAGTKVLHIFNTVTRRTHR